MVFFTCNGCGNAVKKNQVEKHQYQCRKSQHLSCMDCNKDFYGEEYKSHVKCISEEERYSAKGWTPRPNQNKNERKQSEWVEMVQSLVNNLKTADPALLRVLQTISLHENIPRKKPRFMNFLKNIFGNRGNHKVAEQAWDLISKALEEQRAKNNQQQNQVNGKSGGKPDINGVKRKQDDETETNGSIPKKKKEEAEDQNESKGPAEEAEPEENGTTKKVKWTSIGKAILRSQEDKELPLKKFQKKIIAEYLHRVGQPESGVTVEVLWAKCLNKLSKNPKFKIHKDRIKILS